MTATARVRETTVLGTVAPVSAASGRYEICIIEGDRWGSMGYYPANVVERDGPTVFGTGTQMYLDHPTESEEFDRPERSVRDLVGIISSTPTWDGDAKRLMAEATFFGPYADTLREIAPHVGLSINAYATQEPMEVAGRYGPVTTAFVEAVSVDVVTKAGAGGAIVKAIESARSRFLAGQPSSEPKKESEQVEITDKVLSDFTTALTALNTTLTTEAEAREAERLRREEAEKPDPLALVGELAEAKLPKPYQNRVIEAVRAGMKGSDAIAAAQAELAAVLTESGYVKPSTPPARTPVIGAPQGDGPSATVVALPNGLTVDISEARVNRAIGKKVAG